MDDGSARIELRRKNAPSLWAVVDLEDYARVSQRKWYALQLPHTTYARCNIRVDGRATQISMHRFIMDPGSGFDVDHIDHVGLNNRRSNLRVATRSMNLGNMLLLTGGTSRYKGVHFERRSNRAKRWMAQIGIAGKRIKLGRFHTELEAAVAYDAAAVEHFGEFALVNFPDRAA